MLTNHSRINSNHPLGSGLHSKCPNGKNLEDVSVDMWFSVLKELQDKWIVSAYDYLRANPQIGINGFKEAGAIEDPDDFADVAEEN